MIDRRTMLAQSSATLLATLTSALAQTGAKRLVLIHGLGQQGQDKNTLKTKWIAALQEGARENSTPLPTDLEIAFPYYGDVLADFVKQFELPDAKDVTRKGGALDDEYLAYQADIAEALRTRAGVTDQQVDAEYGGDAREKGPLNWAWVQAILRALDKHGGGLSQAALDAFTRDAFLYSTRTVVRKAVDALVAAELTQAPTVVVGHSLGSVVGYNVLRTEARPLVVPLYLTVGSPLGIRAIRNQFVPIAFPKPVGQWFNAYDPRDVVALYPLDGDNFAVTPAIANYAKVKNKTDDRHGIVGYLNDATVAKTILAAT